MAIKTREEILEGIKARMGDNLDDSSISFLEDVTDTFTDLEEKSNSTEDWKTKYEENDSMWRKKYTDRFFSSEPEGSDDSPNVEGGDTVEPKTFEDLFTTDAS